MQVEIEEEKLKKLIQTLVYSQLQMIKDESEDWGLGEMYELSVLDSINRVEVDRINSVKKFKVYINIYLNEVIDDMQDFRSEIQYRLENWIPNVEIYINELRSTDGSVIDIDNDYWDI